MARAAVRRLSVALRAVCALVAVAAAGALAAVAPACYSGGGGTAPPTNSFYFPVGLAVSAGGHVLYAANSDFDLQWNGGTLQSYDLASVRKDVASLLQANFASSEGDGAVPPSNPWLDASTQPTTQIPWFPNCLSDAAVLYQGNRIPLGEACAPPVESARYIQDSAVIGAFVTDIAVEPLSLTGNGPTRMFSPVRGDATITWADLSYDDPNTLPPCISSNASNSCANAGANASLPSAFHIQCGQSASNLLCDGEHHTSTTAAGNTRQETLPGEPFGIALTQDGTAVAVTALTEPMTSLLMSGFNPPPATGEPVRGRRGRRGRGRMRARTRARAGTRERATRRPTWMPGRG
jgi:hypothetical protein